MIETKYKGIYLNEEDLEIYWKDKKDIYHKYSKWKDSLGYYMVGFRVDGKKHWARLHRIIAETLIPNINNFKQVNHIDGDKTNNSLNNLEWCNNSYNTQQAYDNGLYKSRTRCKVRAIDKISGQIFDFKSIRDCAKTLNLNRKTITSILKGDKINNNYDYKFEYID